MCCCCNVCCTVSDFFLYILATIFPPVAVLMRSGICSADFYLNILLTLCGFIPGEIHAFYYVYVTSPLRMDPEYLYFYQSGWEDRERNAPLLAHQQSGSGYTQVYGTSPQPVIVIQNTSPPAPVIAPQAAPPPYSELPK